MKGLTCVALHHSDAEVFGEEGGGCDAIGQHVVRGRVFIGGLRQRQQDRTYPTEVYHDNDDASVAVASGHSLPVNVSHF